MVPTPGQNTTVRAPVLLTGFDAFGGEVVNPSGLVAQALHGQQIAGHRVVGVTLPTVFHRSIDTLRALLCEHRPGLVVCVGLAAERQALSLERVALNLADARIPDNAGVQPVDTPVVPGGPDAYLSTLPIQAICATLQRQGVPAEVSNSAGTFVCNHVFYGLMHALAQGACADGHAAARGGFIHVPALHSLSRPEGWSMARLVDAVRGAVHCALASPPGQTPGDGPGGSAPP